MDSRVRNHARVQDRSSFGNSPFKSKFCYLGFGTSLLLRKNSCILSYLTAFCIIRIFPPHLYSPFSSFPICPFSLHSLFFRFCSLASPRLPSRNSGIFGTKITQSKVKALVSESGNFFPVKTADFQKLPLTNSRSPDYNISDSEYYGQAAA